MNYLNSNAYFNLGINIRCSKKKSIIFPFRWL